MNRENRDARLGFLEAFEELKEPRSHNCPHPLDELLLVALGGVTAGQVIPMEGKSLRGSHDAGEFSRQMQAHWETSVNIKRLQAGWSTDHLGTLLGLQSS